MPSNTPQDPNVAIAVLFERIGNVMTKLDEVSNKIDSQVASRDKLLNDLETRVDEMESQLARARGFMAGLAAGGGALGGVIASVASHFMGM